MSRRRAALALIGAALHASVAVAQPRDADRILERMEQQMRRDSLEYVGEVVVVSRGGTERRKDWISFRQGSGKTARGLIRFLAPADVRGVAFLTLGHATGLPDQWMYLPSMKRERRLAPQDRDAPFVGTDFSYADLEEFDRADYVASLESADTVDGEACDTIRLTPRGRSPYAYELISVSQSRLVPRRIALVRQGSATPAKVMSFLDYRQIDGYWVALHVEMADTVKNSRTTVRLTGVRVDRPQPSDRYTLQNLVREGADLPGAARLGSPGPAKAVAHSWWEEAQTNGDRRRVRIPNGFTGSLDTGVLLFPKSPVETDPRALTRTRLDVRQQIGRQRIRVAAAARAETENGDQLGRVRWDPFERAPQRSPLSLRELSLGATLASGVDLSVGKFDVSWGSTDTHSPASGFLPRDLTDPLAWENLPLWGARLTAERHRSRLDAYDAFEMTPWRLPTLAGRYSPGARSDLFFVGGTEEAPVRGFGTARLTRLGTGWDVTGWVRAGARPAPLFSFDIDHAEHRPEGRVVTLTRRFASERAGGVEVNRQIGSWLVRGEASMTDSTDADLGRAVFYTAQAEHSYRAGLVTIVYASRGPDTGFELTTPFDRAALPSVTVAMTQSESWGEWRATWLGTLENAGGLFDAEVTRPVHGAWKLVVGAAVPHGSSISAVGAFSDARRLRASLRFAW